LTDTYATLSVQNEIDPVQISAARIHRYDTRITRDEALTSLRNRRERIISLCEWMNAQYVPIEINESNFESYWKPILFPEIVSKKKRPDNWLLEGDKRVRAEDIRWNTGYTERVFPEELWNVRNSGTLLRDWEEALSWIYLEYKWDNIKEILSREITLKKIK